MKQMMYNDFGDSMEIRYLILDDSITFEDVSPYISQLPSIRQEKIARYRFDCDKLTSAVAGFLIRHMIGERSLVYGEHHKPYVKDSNDLFFSVSHSDRCVAIAVDEKEIGVDVEKIRTKDIEKLSQRFFSKGEQAYIDSSEDMPSCFTEIWTRKEAYLKCKGVGITEDLSSFDTTSSELCRFIRSVSLDGYWLSVCSENQLDLSNIILSEIGFHEIL